MKGHSSISITRQKSRLANRQKAAWRIAAAPSDRRPGRIGFATQQRRHANNRSCLCKNGFPALAGVEHFIVAELGERYHPHDQGTMNAGYIVGELMRHLGYIQDGEGKIPEGSVAKTAMKWKRRST
jgi:hypothetical protein